MNSKGTSQVHLSESWSFKVQVRYTSVRVDQSSYRSNTLQWELINDQLSLRCIWTVSYIINFYWGVPDVYPKWSNHSDMYLACILNIDSQCGVFYLYVKWSTLTEVCLSCTLKSNSHRVILDLYLKWSTLLEVHLKCTLNDKLSLSWTSLVR
jgi:hypothetical protein